ncbi:hypothetical protein HMPREF9622_00628 [Cutibacterium modestum HL037PA3]|jgi:hypothetical protein|nr:hypothetical protein HMPREF9621_01081 [Cutibacterium modestum HL037PA2]EFS93727.1 hypothetical protein HMPREF9607_00183 [Cutibacterium modestum HL044PA1]EFT16421.1 hypothetical protein HMPREF9622_00628 [Cutibacterium modestum HL037PA3]
MQRKLPITRGRWLARFLVDARYGHGRYAEFMIDALVFVPMKTLPGWPEANYSSVHLFMLCVVWPIATAVLFTLTGWGVHFAKGRNTKDSD